MQTFYPAAFSDQQSAENIIRHYYEQLGCYHCNTACTYYTIQSIWKYYFMIFKSTKPKKMIFIPDNVVKTFKENVTAQQAE